MDTYRYARTKMAQAMGRPAHFVLRHTPDQVLMTTADYCLREIDYPEGRDFLKTIMLLSKRQLHTKSPAVQSAIINFLANILGKGEIKRKRFERSAGFSPPVLMVVSPTMRCNLRCFGCYAGKYERKDDLGLDTLERLIVEAEDMGIYFMTISGGEPFVLGDDLLDIIGSHPGMMFQIYTNGTLIDDKTAARLARLGNAYPCISVEGFEKETDARRGPGVYKNIMAAMDSLRRHGMLFGFSATATRENNELIISEKFVDFYRRKGCTIGWYFHYVPVGKEPGVELMPTAEQRIFRREEIIKRRSNRDILLADFWNDGPMVGGCIAGGKRYLHINSQGEVEPCVFAHFAVDNIRNKSLREVLESPFFEEIRKRQPYDSNLLRPCMIIDVPEVLREVVTICGAHPTHLGADAVITDFAEDLDKYASSYRSLADTKWSEYDGKDDVPE